MKTWAQQSWGETGVGGLQVSLLTVKTTKTPTEQRGGKN